MGTISLQIPQIGQPDTTEDVKLANGFTTIQNVINGGLDATNLTAAVAQSAGINASGQTVKGASIIATSQNTSSAAFTTLATPDQVTGIVLPSPGLIQVWYQASWSGTVSGAANAAILLGANQLQVATSSGGPLTGPALASNAGTANILTPLTSYSGGLFSPTTGSAYSGDATTGQLIGVSNSGIGGPASIFAAAGTYSVSVQFKTASGTVTVSNRRLYVEAVSFA